MGGFVAGCGGSAGPSGSGENKMDENALKAMEHGRLRTLASRVAILDSLIATYNDGVPEDLQIEPFVFDSNYLKMFHGEKFNEKFIGIVTEIESKEASVLTSIRANRIMPHDK